MITDEVTLTTPLTKGTTSTTSYTTQPEQGDPSQQRGGADDVSQQDASSKIAAADDHDAFRALSPSTTMEEIEKLREEKQAAIRSSMELTLTHCVIAILCYIGLMALCFSLVLDHWTFIDSCYFAVVTFTTVGYGDLVPESAVARIFTCIYALSGIAFWGIALGVLGARVMEAQEQAFEQATKTSQRRIMSMFSSHSLREAFHLNVQPQESGHEEKDLNHTNTISSTEPTYDMDEAVWSRACTKILCELVLVIGILLIFSYLMSNEVDITEKPAWDIGDVLYMAIITATTVGYGDLSPKTQRGRLIAVVGIPLAVGAMGHWLSVVASSILEIQQRRARHRLLHQKLSLEDIQVMDADGDGLVTRAEFLEFMLIAMNKVDKDLIMDLRDQFNRLDADGSGFLSKEDLVAVTKKKMKTC